MARDGEADLEPVCGGRFGHDGRTIHQHGAAGYCCWRRNPRRVWPSLFLLYGRPFDFLEKPFDSSAILTAIDEALRLALASGAALTVDRETLAEPVERLTERERGRGQPNKAIARRLKIALRTVEIHRARVMEKSGALSELVRMAIRLNGSA